MPTKQILVKPCQNKHAGISVNSGLDMDEIDETMFFNPSQQQTVSCGTAAIDLKRGRILSLFNKKLGIAQLPKGRKQINEALLDAALRETLEESGIVVKPLPLKVATRSSALPGTEPTNGRYRGPFPDTDVVSDTPNHEFIGVVRYPDPQSQTENTLKSIYWFAATFDLDDVEALDEHQEKDKFVVCAYSIQDTLDTLRFEAEKEVVRKLVADLTASGVEIGSD